jgi:hypothetical protein
MRSMNCRNVTSEIEQAEPGELLSAAVRAHLAGCAVCEKISREQSKLQTIISSLGTVEAPGDFEYRLRARLAGEKRGERFYSLRSFSFGLRAAAVASLLLLIGSAFVFVTFKTRPDSPGTQDGNGLAADALKTPNHSPDNVNAPRVADGPQQVAIGVKETDPKPVDREPQRRRNLRNSTVAFKGSVRDVSQDQGLSQARVLKPFSEGFETYPTAAFPINASYQSLKVSVDDGRGASRTISLPTVSFGSQQALSQTASPLMASARGVW